jgi:hypothetical protein
LEALLSRYFKAMLMQCGLVMTLPDNGRNLYWAGLLSFEKSKLFKSTFSSMVVTWPRASYSVFSICKKARKFFWGIIVRPE